MLDLVGVIEIHAFGDPVSQNRIHATVDSDNLDSCISHFRLTRPIYMERKMEVLH